MRRVLLPHLPSTYGVSLIVPYCWHVTFRTEVFSSQRRPSELEAVPCVSRSTQMTHRSSRCVLRKILRRRPPSAGAPSFHSQASRYVLKQWEEDRCGSQKAASREQTCGPQARWAAGLPPSAQVWGLPGPAHLCVSLSDDILKHQGLQYPLTFFSNNLFL